jgi:hypothetical protein
VQHINQERLNLFALHHFSQASLSKVRRWEPRLLLMNSATIMADEIDNALHMVDLTSALMPGQSGTVRMLVFPSA